jgi:hypothetical protein
MSSTTPGSDPERPYDDDGAAEHDADRAARAEHDVERPAEPRPASPDDSTDTPEASGPESSGPESSGPVPPAPVDERDESLDATARLDAAVGRANAVPVASDADDTHEARDADDEVPEPVPADTVRRETYVPAATVAAPGIAAGAATLAPEPERESIRESPREPAAASVPQTVYVQAPTPPKTRSNRGFGVLVALIGAVAFALLYAGVAYLLLLGRGDAAEATEAFVQFLLSPLFWVPVVGFFVGFALLAVIVNRGAWWYYAVFGLLVGALVYFAYIGGALLTVQAWTLTREDAAEFLRERWLDPFAIAALLIAREIPIWLGGWLARRGRAVGERNRLAREAYDRELAAGPQPQRA